MKKKYVDDGACRFVRSSYLVLCKQKEEDIDRRDSIRHAYAPCIIRIEMKRRNSSRRFFRRLRIIVRINDLQLECRHWSSDEGHISAPMVSFRPMISNFKHRENTCWFRFRCDSLTHNRASSTSAEYTLQITPQDSTWAKNSVEPFACSNQTPSMNSIDNSLATIVVEHCWLKTWASYIEVEEVCWPSTTFCRRASVSKKFEAWQLNELFPMQQCFALGMRSS